MSAAPALPDLAERINAEHGQAHAAARTAIEHAVECGRLLLEAKAQVAHGEWLPWIEANLSFGDRQAQKYTRLTKFMAGKSELLNSHLSLDGALAAIAEPKPQTPRPPHKPKWEPAIPPPERPELKPEPEPAAQPDQQRLPRPTISYVLDLIDAPDDEESWTFTGTSPGAIVEITAAGSGYVHVTVTSGSSGEAIGTKQAIRADYITEVLTATGIDIPSLRWRCFSLEDEPSSRAAPDPGGRAMKR